jgi:hypothetical protein
MQVGTGPSDRVPVDDPAPAWGAAFPEMPPAIDWRTSIPREFVARTPVGAPDPVPAADDPAAVANGRSAPLSSLPGGYAPPGPTVPDAPSGGGGTGTLGSRPAAQQPQAHAGTAYAPVTGRSATTTSPGAGATTRPPGPGAGTGRDTSSHASPPPAPDEAGRGAPGGAGIPAGPGATTGGPGTPGTHGKPGGIPRQPMRREERAQPQAPAATAPRMNGVNGVNGVHNAPTGGELVLADQAAGVGTPQRPAEGPWNELDREIARAVAATLAGKLARYVNPNLLPLVAEELGRTISPDTPRKGDGGAPDAGRAG